MPKAMVPHRCLHAVFLGTFVFAFAGSARGQGHNDWHGRSIYFILIDRFAQSVEDVAPSCDGKGWCGGTLRGIERKLDYIQGMGFDAIWITPVVEQVDWLDNWNGTGYHGYWARDFSSIDPHFGRPEDLLNLRKACTTRGMLLMLDIVANHVGPIHSLDQVRQLGFPFNLVTGDQFHQLGRDPDQDFESYINHPTASAAPHCWPDYGSDCNLTIVEQGWFGDLADLRQEHDGTRSYLLAWVKDLVTRYGLNGLRLDTALYMPHWFLKELQEAAGVYMIGEVVTHNVTFHSSFAPPLQGLLNFPVAGRLPEIFKPEGSLLLLRDLLEEQQLADYPDQHLLGNFIDNHDVERFQHSQGDAMQVRNGLVWTLLHHGIPIVYYGTEQDAVSGAPDGRTSMWPHFGATDLYSFLMEIHALRQDYGFASGGKYVTHHAHVVSVTRNTLVFVRGEILVLLTNLGTGAATAKACVNPADLPSHWADSCSRTRPVLGRNTTARASCESGHLCLQSEGGEPAVFAVSNTWLTWLV